ncbi:outer membrane protein assembly factor BamB [Gilvimarinus sp. SDUM040013]|uniref:Outer membrane protein assembly factor BamB n=1 Tax=Gilvimarinus gilvus TaxID=3058038 RepID=A0ABU4RUD9_9GAMM|nr:outer membrane protein assembly factor BamB [Gilvimarinus sp. SDUM040013]MDO3385120.1 outer membrane protein assembly factor BamB [Gilvimarinus sp. SDUM040013]MDX6848495.1 outer membrane protein assembly factor BamB [Gilvimarinus sp. SDUM040013]
MRLVPIVALAFVLSGCSLFGSKDGTEPMELVDFEPTIDVDRLWQRDVGAGQGAGFTTLTPAFAENLVYTVDYQGELTALDRMTGKVAWKRDLDEPIAGGVGLGADQLLLGSDEGEIVALTLDSGEELWRTPLSGEVTSVPAGNADVVAVQTLDGRLNVLNAESGELLWFYDNPPPKLTLRGRPTPVLTDSAVYAGFANGRLMAFNPQNGLILWEQRVGLPKGRSDLEKMVDIHATPLLQDGILYVGGFQSRLMAITRATGRPLWSADASIHQPVWMSAGELFVATEQSAVVAYNAASGAEIWKNEQMLRRQLIGPVVVGGYIAVADEEGYIHFMDRSDGSFVDRLRIDSSGTRAPMWSDGERLYVLANDGTFAAYTIDD